MSGVDPGNVGDAESEAELDREPLDRAGLIEPEQAKRLSPYGIAAVAAALLGLWVIPQGTLFLAGALRQGPPGYQFAAVMTIVVPVVCAGIALWLAGWADAERVHSHGMIGGVGLVRAARIIAVATFCLAGVSLIAGLI